MRTAPSAADRHLISRLAEENIRVTPTQLERWRHLGLIPRAHVVRSTFGGSTVAEHDDDVLYSCAVLAHWSGRGRPWQVGAVALFEEGQDLSTVAVRKAAEFQLDRQVRGLRSAWSRAEVGADPPGQDPGEWVADVATHAARHAGRANRKAVREEVAYANPHLAQHELREAAHRALVWRIADINVPALLTQEQRRWARTGSDEALDPLRAIPIPLPSERAACVATLTWPEASLARWLLQEEGFESDEIPLLTAATWRVAMLRLDEDFAHPERPLDPQVLVRIRNRTLEVMEEQRGEGESPSDETSPGKTP